MIRTNMDVIIVIHKKGKTLNEMLSYVDDNNISNNGASYKSIKKGIKQTQHDTQLWNDILCST